MFCGATPIAAAQDHFLSGRAHGLSFSSEWGGVLNLQNIGVNKIVTPYFSDKILMNPPPPIHLTE